jgi:RNA polymerase sigma-70 factor (ECF subfamily)
VTRRVDLHISVIYDPAKGGITPPRRGDMADFPVDRDFWNGLLRQIVKRTRRKADAEDLLQSAYLRLMRYRESHTVENVPGFLVKTAINIGVDNYRRERLLAEIAPEVGGGIENSPLQDEVLATRTRLKRMEEGLSKLSPRTREIFLMHRLDNLKYREIADRLTISGSAVEKHIARAALFLCEWMEGW